MRQEIPFPINTHVQLFQFKPIWVANGLTPQNGTVSKSLPYSQ